jgi:hypothetical protein
MPFSGPKKEIECIPSSHSYLLSIYKERKTKPLLISGFSEKEDGK